MSATSKTDSSREDADVRRLHAPPLHTLLTNSAFLVLLVDLLLIVLFSLVSRDNVFWSIPNAEALMRNGTQLLLLGLGVGLLMSAGFFDLSVGANLVLASMISALTVKAAIAAGIDPVMSALLGLAAAIAVGALFGVVNGLIVTRLKVNSLIATLGTMGIGSGIANLLTNGQDVRQLPGVLQSGFALVKVGIVPLPMICALVLMLGGWLLIRYTRFGMRTLAIGSNEAAALRAGINVQLHIVILAALAGALAGLAGFVDIARLGSTAVASHALDGLNAVTAVVIGGTAIAGGRANIPGILFGAALTIILLSGLIIIRVAPFWQLVVTGIVLIAAVAFDGFRAQRLERH